MSLNPVTLPGIDPGTVRLVAQRLNHFATPGPKKKDDPEYYWCSLPMGCNTQRQCDMAAPRLVLWVCALNSICCCEYMSGRLSKTVPQM
jgi:hypothetical protein